MTIESGVKESGMDQSIGVPGGNGKQSERDSIMDLEDRLMGIAQDVRILAHSIETKLLPPLPEGPTADKKEVAAIASPSSFVDQLRTDVNYMCDLLGNASEVLQRIDREF